MFRNFALEKLVTAWQMNCERPSDGSLSEAHGDITATAQTSKSSAEPDTLLTPPSPRENHHIQRAKKRIKLSTSLTEPNESFSSHVLKPILPPKSLPSSSSSLDLLGQSDWDDELSPAQDSEPDDEEETLRILHQMRDHLPFREERDGIETEQGKDAEEVEEGADVSSEEDDIELFKRKLYVSRTVDEYGAPPHTQYVRSVFAT